MNKDWLKALGQMTYGIYVLTSFFEDEINGMIASWVSQVSYEPPLVMTAVHPNRYSHHLVQQSGYFALHVLADHQQDFIRRFKGDAPRAKFDGLTWQKGQTGCPILTDCIAGLECAVSTTLKPGNHTLFIGTIVHVHVGSSAHPLNTSQYEGTYTGRI